jgi:hypothetical protein
MNNAAKLQRAHELLLELEKQVHEIRRILRGERCE